MVMETISHSNRPVEAIQLTVKPLWRGCWRVKPLPIIYNAKFICNLLLFCYIKLHLGFDCCFSVESFFWGVKRAEQVM